MRPGEPSRTAFGAARHRAVHQDAEGGRVFTDPLAWRILGEDHRAEQVAAAEEHRALRLFIAVRHRFAEDTVAAAYERGVRQVVVLGAGLDTFGYRDEHPDLRVFEVDHPDTGAWKQERLAEAGIEVPASVTHVGVDFEGDNLGERLGAAGVDLGSGTVFLWLGVVPYLTRDAIETTLRVVAAVPDGEVVFDYPTRTLSEDPRIASVREDLQRRTAAAGEPLRSAFDPEEVADLLHRLGFDEVEDLGAAEFVPRFFGVPAPDRRGGGHVVRARHPLTAPGAGTRVPVTG